MADNFLGEIRLFAGNFAPVGWAFCEGQLIPIAQNPALFSLLGTMYGGNGMTTFALPDLRGAAPLGAGAGPFMTSRLTGETGGAASVTLQVAELPNHVHDLSTGLGEPDSVDPTNALLGPAPVYATTAPSTTLNAGVVAPAGSSLPHNNLPPFLPVSFIIALQGVFPSRP
jgi:microcystin-dependent protein